MNSLRPGKLRRRLAELAADGLGSLGPAEAAAEMGLDLKASYGQRPLLNPLMVASGQLTRFPAQIRKITAAGYGGYVLKSVVGEDASGRASMQQYRLRPTFISSVYDDDDAERDMPVIKWSGRLDTRPLRQYLPFAAACADTLPACRPVYSFLAHLPGLQEQLQAEEWLHTAACLVRAGALDIEIDFCPFLQAEQMLTNRESVLRWYGQCTALLKEAFPDVGIYPKLINPLWGDAFYEDMMRAAVDGGADGLTVANRIFLPAENSAIGGSRLREQNLRLAAACRRLFPGLPISASGGIYSGRHVYEYLQAGATSVQLLSFIMGRVNRAMAGCGDKFRRVLAELLLHPENGLFAAMLQAGQRRLDDVCK